MVSNLGPSLLKNPLLRTQWLSRIWRGRASCQNTWSCSPPTLTTGNLKFAPIVDFFLGWLESPSSLAGSQFSQVIKICRFETKRKNFSCDVQWEARKRIVCSENLFWRRSWETGGKYWERWWHWTAKRSPTIDVRRRRTNRSRSRGIFCSAPGANGRANENLNSPFLNNWIFLVGVIFPVFFIKYKYETPHSTATETGY